MITVRNATTSNLNQIVQWQLAMAMESEQMQLDLDTVTAGVRAMMEQPAWGQYLMGEVSGQPVGCLLMQYEWSDWRNGQVIWLHSLYIDPKFRRVGVFRKMYDHVLQLAQNDPKLRGIRLYVDHGNEKAIRTYQQIGMTDDHYRLFEWMKS